MTLGSILVRLTMNTADFETDAGRAAKVADRRAKEIDASFKKAGVAIGLALSAGLAVATRVFTETVDRMDEMSKASQKVGMPTEDFSRLAYAGELADVSMDSLVTTLGRLTKAQAAALKDTSQQAQVFDALGISIKNADGSLRDASAVFSDFADKFKELNGSEEARGAGFILFGRSFQEMIPLLKDGSAGLREAAEESDRLGKTLSTEAGEAAELFNDNLTRLKGAAQGMAMEIATSLLPEFIELTEQALAWVKEGDNAEQITTDIADGMRTLADTIGLVVSVASGLGTIREQLAGAENAWRSLVGNMGVNGMFSNALKDAAPWLYKEFGSVPKQPKSQNTGEVPDYLKVGVLNGQQPFRATNPVFNLVGPKTIDPKKLRDALGGNQDKNKTGGGARKKELTDEQKAAQELERAYDSLKESMAERIGLFGAETEVAKVTYETQHGALKALDETRKSGLLTQAAELDALRERQQLEEDGKRLMESLLEPFEQVNAERAEALKLLQAGVIAQEDYNKAIEASKTPAEQMLEDLRLETEMLGKTREQQEMLNAARLLGAEAATTQGKAALQALADYQAAAKATAEQVEFMDGVRDSFGDFFTSIIDGSKSAKDAFKDLVADILAQITKLMVNRAIEQMFGAYGSTGAGTTGGGFFSSLFSAFAGSYGGGRAAGGPVSPGKFYRVNEEGPELLDVGGRQYLMTGSRGGAVKPIASGGRVSLTQNFNTIGIETRRTSERKAQLAGREARRAMARTGR